MNLASLDLNLLVALEALLEEGSVGRAAERVSLSQPAMSHALKRLRDLIADPLLVRVGPQMQLTVRAKALRLPLQEILSRTRELLESEPFDPSRSTRTFRVSVSDNATDLLLPALLKRLQREAPNVSLRIQAGARGAIDQTDPGRDLDVAVACYPKNFKGFYQRRLFTDRDACAVRRNHPLRKRLRRQKDFLAARHVAVVGRTVMEDPVDTWLRHEGFARNVALTVPHYLQALHVVAQSDLIAVIPERLIRAYASALRLEGLAVPLDAGTFDEFLLHPAPTHSDPGCVWLRGLLVDIAQSLGPLE
jgi:DNA-binding transcriptional LysR family regulator